MSSTVSSIPFQFSTYHRKDCTVSEQSMKTSQYSNSSLDMDNPSSLVKKVLRPMEQTSLWTFSSALALLKSVPEDYISDALDDFLIHNNEVLNSPLPFCNNDPQSLENTTKDFTLRGVLFSGATPSIVALANTISKACKTDPYETLRVILQTTTRVPEPQEPPQSKESLKSRLPSEDSTEAEQDRLVHFAEVLLNERRTVLRVTSECFNNRFNEHYSSTVRNLGKSLAVGPDFAVSLVEAAQSIILQISNEEDSDLHDLISTSNLLVLEDILKLLYELLVSTPAADKSVVASWFTFMDKSNFAHVLGAYLADKEVFTLVQALSTVITLQLLDMAYSQGRSVSNLYFIDGRVFAQVDDIITRRKSNDIVQYAWLIMLYKKSILIEEFPQQERDFQAGFTLSQVQHSMALLQQNIDGAKVFEEVRALNDFLKFDNVFAISLSTLVITALPLVTMTPQFASCVSEVLKNAPNSTIENFFEDPQAINALILARAKFPISLIPYLKLASINGNFASQEFLELKSYMALFDKNEFGLMYDIDSENTDLVKTSQLINLYPPFEVNKKLSFLMSYDTKAKIVSTSDDSKVLVTFLHKYNGWAFLGRVLQNISKVFDITDDDKNTLLYALIDLITATAEQNNSESVNVTLEYMSAYIDDSDIVDVFFRLLEQGLHNRSVALLEKLLRLLAALVPVIPHRIWPYLSSSSLLLSKGKEGFLSILFGAVEMVKGDYQFTTAVVKFVFSLSHDCFSLQNNYPIESKSDLYAKFIDHLLFVFESFSGCKFNDSFQKLEMGVLILDVLRKTLEATYLIQSGEDVQQKATRVFATASERIIEVFLSADARSVRSATSIFLMIDSVADSINYYEARDFSGYFSDVWIQSALSFCQLLVTIRSNIKAAPSQFEKKLFLKLPQLVTIYSRGGYFRKLSLDLITSLTNGVWQNEPMPSMLSHLGREHSRILLHSLAADLNNAFDDYTIKISIYDFLCAIMEANQQGLSILFISGRDIFGEFTNVKAKGSSSISLLSVLKKNVNLIKYYPHSVTVHLLDAIALAFNSWTTERDEESDVSFVNELVTMLSTSEKRNTPSDGYELIAASYESKLISKVAEILSLVLFTTKNEKCINIIVDLLVSDKFLSKCPEMFQIKSFQVSLYDQVASQFEAVFPEFKLSQFSVAIPKRNRFGIGAVFNLLLMDTLFQKHPKWKELMDQIIYSSANIQYYNAQIALGKSLGALITAFCRKSTTKLSSGYWDFVPKLIGIREPRDSYSQAYIRQQCMERVELGFLIAYKINGVETITKSPRTALDIIEACGDLMRDSDFADGQDELERSLLRLIYVALSVLAGEYEILIARFSILRDLFDMVIARSTKNIIIELQNDVYLSKTQKKHGQANIEQRFADLKLILSIMKSFFQLKLSPALHNDLCEYLAKAGTVESLLGLYSFSHLILLNEEPVCAQLSLMFIQQLLSVDAFAERFVGSSVFMVIRESMISQVLRNGGITVTNASSVYRTWTNGILPILTHSLVQTAQLQEVVATVRYFSKQIEFCIEGWAKDSSSLQLSTAGTWETTQILVLQQMLQSIVKKHTDCADASASLSMPGLESQQKRDDFIDHIDNLLKHPKFLSSRVVSSGAEDAAVIKAGGAAMKVLVDGLIGDIRELKQYMA